MRKHTAPVSRSHPLPAEVYFNPCKFIIGLLNNNVPGASKLMDKFNCWLV